MAATPRLRTLRCARLASQSGQLLPFAVAAEFPVSSRSDQQTDVAMAVEPRRHQGGDPVDHLQGREAQLAAPARTWLGDLI